MVIRDFFANFIHLCKQYIAQTKEMREENILNVKRFHYQIDILLNSMGGSVDQCKIGVR